MRALILLTAIAVGFQTSGWQANPQIVEQTATQQPGFNYDESRVGSYTLPELLRAGTSTVSTPEAWRARRAALLDLFREHVYGRTPVALDSSRFDVVEKDAQAIGGSATLERIGIVSRKAGREHRFELTLFLPKTPAGPVPVVLLLNNRPASNTDPTRKEKSGFWPAEEVLARGYGIAALQVAEIAPDDKDRFRDGAIRLFEGDGGAARPGNAWGALAAWAWGASRAMDYLETDPRVDRNRVAVLGHSRGGKAALWAGAQDERFAIVISNESGEGGAALSRRNFGETVARITDSFPHWFAGNYRGYAGRPQDLPVDQHMLVALVAPRAVYVASADGDLWSDPRGEFLSLANASPVFALWGEKSIASGDMPPLDHPLVVGRRGYHVRTGTHNLTPYDWQRFIDFAETLPRK